MLADAQRGPRALFLVVNFFCIAVFYLLLDAPFLFAVQIIVYAGAIMVLFLFVIMLLGVDRSETRGERLSASGRSRSCSGWGSWSRSSSRSAPASGSRRGRRRASTAVNAGGNTQALAEVLFRRLLLPVRGDVDPADRRRDRGDGAGRAAARAVTRGRVGRSAPRPATAEPPEAAS